MTPRFQKHQQVAWKRGELTFTGHVMTRHRDGTVTVRGQWAFDAEGNRTGGFHGDIKSRVIPANVDWVEVPAAA